MASSPPRGGGPKWAASSSVLDYLRMSDVLVSKLKQGSPLQQVAEALAEQPGVRRARDLRIMADAPLPHAPASSSAAAAHHAGGSPVAAAADAAPPPLPSWLAEVRDLRQVSARKAAADVASGGVPSRRSAVLSSPTAGASPSAAAAAASSGHDRLALDTPPSSALRNAAGWLPTIRRPEPREDAQTHPGFSTPVVVPRREVVVGALDVCESPMAAAAVGASTPTLGSGMRTGGGGAGGFVAPEPPPMVAPLSSVAARRSASASRTVGSGAPSSVVSGIAGGFGGSGGDGFLGGGAYTPPRMPPRSADQWSLGHGSRSPVAVGVNPLGTRHPVASSSATSSLASATASSRAALLASPLRPLAAGFSAGGGRPPLASPPGQQRALHQHASAAVPGRTSTASKGTTRGRRSLSPSGAGRLSPTLAGGGGGGGGDDDGAGPRVIGAEVIRQAASNHPQAINAATLVDISGVVAQISQTEIIKLPSFGAGGTIGGDFGDSDAALAVDADGSGEPTWPHVRQSKSPQSKRSRTPSPASGVRGSGTAQRARQGRRRSTSGAGAPRAAGIDDSLSPLGSTYSAGVGGGGGDGDHSPRFASGSDGEADGSDEETRHHRHDLMAALTGSVSMPSVLHNHEDLFRDGSSMEHYGGSSGDGLGALGGHTSQGWPRQSKALGVNADIPVTVKSGFVQLALAGTTTPMRIPLRNPGLKRPPRSTVAPAAEVAAASAPTTTVGSGAAARPSSGSATAAQADSAAPVGLGAHTGPPASAAAAAAAAHAIGVAALTQDRQGTLAPAPSRDPVVIKHMRRKHGWNFNVVKALNSDLMQQLEAAELAVEEAIEARKAGGSAGGGAFSPKGRAASRSAITPGARTGRSPTSPPTSKPDEGAGFGKRRDSLGAFMPLDRPQLKPPPLVAAVPPTPSSANRSGSGPPTSTPGSTNASSLAARARLAKLSGATLKDDPSDVASKPLSAVAATAVGAYLARAAAAQAAATAAAAAAAAAPKGRSRTIGSARRKPSSRLEPGSARVASAREGSRTDAMADDGPEVPSDVDQLPQRAGSAFAAQGRRTRSLVSASRHTFRRKSAGIDLARHLQAEEGGPLRARPPTSSAMKGPPIINPATGQVGASPQQQQHVAFKTSRSTATDGGARSNPTSRTEDLADVDVMELVGHVSSARGRVLTEMQQDAERLAMQEAAHRTAVKGEKSAATAALHAAVQHSTGQAQRMESKVRAAAARAQNRATSASSTGSRPRSVHGIGSSASSTASLSSSAHGSSIIASAALASLQQQEDPATLERTRQATITAIRRDLHRLGVHPSDAAAGNANEIAAVRSGAPVLKPGGGPGTQLPAKQPMGVAGAGIPHSGVGPSRFRGRSAGAADDAAAGAAPKTAPAKPATAAAKKDAAAAPLQPYQIPRKHVKLAFNTSHSAQVFYGSIVALEGLDGWFLTVHPKTGVVAVREPEPRWQERAIMPFRKTRDRAAGTVTDAPIYLFRVIHLGNPMANGPVRFGDPVWFQVVQGRGDDGWRTGSVLAPYMHHAANLDAGAVDLAGRPIAHYYMQKASESNPHLAKSLHAASADNMLFGLPTFGAGAAGAIGTVDAEPRERVMSHVPSSPSVASLEVAEHASQVLSQAPVLTDVPAAVDFAPSMVALVEQMDSAVVAAQRRDLVFIQPTGTAGYTISALATDKVTKTRSLSHAGGPGASFPGTPASGLRRPSDVHAVGVEGSVFTTFSGDGGSLFESRPSLAVPGVTAGTPMLPMTAGAAAGPSMFLTGLDLGGDEGKAADDGDDGAMVPLEHDDTLARGRAASHAAASSTAEPPLHLPRYVLNLMRVDAPELKPINGADYIEKLKREVGANARVNPLDRLAGKLGVPRPIVAHTPVPGGLQDYLFGPATSQNKGGIYRRSDPGYAVLYNMANARALTSGKWRMQVALKELTEDGYVIGGLGVEGHVSELGGMLAADAANVRLHRLPDGSRPPDALSLLPVLRTHESIEAGNKLKTKPKDPFASAVDPVNGGSSDVAAPFTTSMAADAGAETTKVIGGTASKDQAEAAESGKAGPSLDVRDVCREYVMNMSHVFMEHEWFYITCEPAADMVPAQQEPRPTGVTAPILLSPKTAELDASRRGSIFSIHSSAPPSPGRTSAAAPMGDDGDDDAEDIASAPKPALEDSVAKGAQAAPDCSLRVHQPSDGVNGGNRRHTFMTSHTAGLSGIYKVGAKGVFRIRVLQVSDNSSAGAVTRDDIISLRAREQLHASQRQRLGVKAPIDVIATDLQAPSSELSVLGPSFDRSDETAAVNMARLLRASRAQTVASATLQYLSHEAIKFALPHHYYQARLSNAMSRSQQREASGLLSTRDSRVGGGGSLSHRSVASAGSPTRVAPHSRFPASLSRAGTAAAGARVRSPSASAPRRSGDMPPGAPAAPPICKGCAVGGYHVALCQANRDVLTGMEHERLEAERAPVDNSAYARLQRRNSLLVQAATPDPRRPSLSLHSAAAADAAAAAAGAGATRDGAGAPSSSRSAESTTESVRELPSEPPSVAGSASSKHLARSRSTAGTTAPPTDVSTPGRFNGSAAASGAPAPGVDAAAVRSVIEDDADLGPSIMEQAAAWEASVLHASEMTQELLKEDAGIAEIVDYRLKTDSPPPLRPVSTPSGVRLPARKFDLKALINMRR